MRWWRYEKRTSRRFGAKSFLPDELVKARLRTVNSPRGRSDRVTEYSRICRPTRRATPRIVPACARVSYIFRILHIGGLSRRFCCEWNWTLQRALELSGIPSLREIASFEFNRFPHSYISLVSCRLSELLIVLRKIGGLMSCHSVAMLRSFWVICIYIATILIRDGWK